MKTPFDAAVEERLVRYARIDSQSDEESTTVPSTAIQFDMLRELERELCQIGAQDVLLTDNGFVLATVPATAERPAPTVAFLAHVDTAPQYNATGVKPIVHRAWDGSDIVLPDDPSKVLRAQDDTYLAGKVGEDIVTAGGLTLLGADDKAGVAIVMTLAEHLLKHPEIEHGPLRLCFTPDEEIGTGIAHLDLDLLGADVAYTLDGSRLGEVTYESFSADKAVVTIKGVSVHPGTARGILVNALHLAAKLLTLLPQARRTPETTSDRDGFLHAYQISGGASEAKVSFILRDFELDGLQAHGDLLRLACQAVQATEPRATIDCVITKQYRNMRYWLEKDMRPVDLVVQAMKNVGIEPFFNPIRGGTDGSQLTERGLPTPNIFCGSMQVHGPLEWCSVQDMGRATEVCVELARLWAAA